MAAAKRRNAAVDWGVAFLDAIATGSSITKAAAKAGVHRQTVWERTKADEAFRIARQHAEEAYTDLLEDTLFERAVAGVVVHRGWELNQATGKRVQTAETKRFSDPLLMFKMRQRDPSYRDRYQVDATVSGTIAHTHEVTLLDGRNPVEVSADSRREAARLLLQGDVIEGNGRPVEG